MLHRRDQGTCPRGTEERWRHLPRGSQRRHHDVLEHTPRSPLTPHIARPSSCQHHVPLCLQADVSCVCIRIPARLLAYLLQIPASKEEPSGDLSQDGPAGERHTRTHSHDSGGSSTRPHMDAPAAGRHRRLGVDQDISGRSGQLTCTHSGLRRHNWANRACHMTRRCASSHWAAVEGVHHSVCVS